MIENRRSKFEIPPFFQSKMLLKPKYFMNLSCESFHKNATESQTKFLASKAEEERGILLETNMKEATYLK